MSGEIEIRRAATQDLDRIVEIENLCFDTDRYSRRQFAYLIARAKGALYVAVSGGAVAGYVSLLEHRGRRNLRIYSIAVHPRFRGRNVAQTLIDQAVRHALRRGLTALSLEVRLDNTPALKLYEKNGFSAVSVKKAFFPDGADAYWMVKEL